MLANNECGTYQRAFRFGGKTYIENRKTVRRGDLMFLLPAVLTEIYIVEGRKKRSVCTFDLRDSDPEKRAP